ncbi:hypothetical protein [Brucella rhizosphaerae]|uniref:hypothetical protein n=1 Tax=Brucella rhizosphaerae TaxID=571254 RepID=UPI00046440D7|nr:hypothetical protein [Brucella rhizosphaerae]
MIWFLILNSGIVGGTIGPSPLTLDQCNKFAEERTREHQQVISTGINLKGKKLSADQIEKLKNISFRCVQQDERPQFGDRP